MRQKLSMVYCSSPVVSCQLFMVNARRGKNESNN